MNGEAESEEEREARAAWRTATDFAGLCALGRRFVLGELAYFPGWGAPDLDLESDAIEHWLAAYHEAGLLTLASQPGGGEERGADGRPERRRAFLAAFASDAAARRLDGLLPELRVFRSPVRGGAGASAADDAGLEPAGLVVGERGGEPFLWAGAAAGPEELELFADDLAPAALEDLACCTYVSIVDPVWGREDELWPRLAAALGCAGA